MLLFFIALPILAAGIYLFVADRLHLPDYQTSKAVAVFTPHRKKRITPQIIYNDLCVFFAKFVRLNVYKHARITADLQALGENMTAEMYTVKAVLSAARYLILIIPFAIIFPLGIFLVLFFFLRGVFANMRSVHVLTQIKKEHIEAELPRFVSTIENALTLDRNVLRILERYQKNTTPEFASELAITIADMRSGNEETALIRMEGRVGSSALSSVVRGLIGVLRGDDNKSYWQHLSERLSDLERQKLLAKAKKVPSKITALTAILFICMLIIIGYVMLSDMGLDLGVLL